MCNLFGDTLTGREPSLRSLQKLEFPRCSVRVSFSPEAAVHDCHANGAFSACTGGSAADVFSLGTRVTVLIFVRRRHKRASGHLRCCYGHFLEDAVHVCGGAAKQRAHQGPTTQQASKLDPHLIWKLLHSLTTLSACWPVCSGAGTLQHSVLKWINAGLLSAPFGGMTSFPLMSWKEQI